METVTKKNGWQKIHTWVAMLLVAMFIVPPLSLGVAPKPAAAQDVGGAAVNVAACLVANLVGRFMGAIGGAVGEIAGVLSVPVTDRAVTAYNRMIAQTTQATASNGWSLIVKECVLDTLIWALKEMIIQQLMRDVIGWIEGGFEGTPGFVQDTGRWFKDLGSEFLEDVLFESGLGELCEPFRADIQFSMFLDMSTPKYTSDGNGKMRCNLDDFLDGSTFDVFVENGDFNSAGISGMFGVQMDNNNPVNSYFSLQESISERLEENVVAPLENMLAYGNGFISTKCDEDGNPENGNESTCTPGKFIQEQLSEHASAPMQELIAADEFAEILNALIAAFVREVLSDEGGLLGKSSDGDYWDSARDGGRGPDASVEWCEDFPDIEGCEEYEPEPPVPPEPPEPPCVENDDAQIAQLDEFKEDLLAVAQTLMSILASRGVVVRATWGPRLNEAMLELGGVDTTRWAAYADLNAVRESLRNVAIGIGVGFIVIPPALLVPPPPDPFCP